MRDVTLLAVLICSMPLCAEPGPTPRSVRLDMDGEILPDGAIARLGSRKFRDLDPDRLFVDDSGRIVTCFDGNAVRWWDLKTGRYLRGWAAPQDRPVWFSADGRIAAWSDAARVHVWDGWNDRRIRILRAPENAKVLDAAISRSGRQLAARIQGTAGNSDAILLCDLNTGQGEAVGKLVEPTWWMSFADGDRLLLIQSDSLSVVGWDLVSKDKRWRLELHIARVIDRSGRRLVAENVRDESKHFFDAATGEPVENSTALSGEDCPRCITDLSPDGGTILTDSLEIWRLFEKTGNGALTLRFAGMGRGNIKRRAAAFTPDGRHVVLYHGLRLHVCDIATRKQLTPDLPGWGDTMAPHRFFWSANGKYVVTQIETLAEVDGEKSVLNVSVAWDGTTGARIGFKSYRDVSFVPERLPHLRDDWSDCQTKVQCPCPFDAFERRLGIMPGLTRTADHALLACGRYDCETLDINLGALSVTICRGWNPPLHMESPTVFEAASGRALFTLPVKHCGRVAFSPDGRRLAVIEADGVQLYDVPSGKKLLRRSIPKYAMPDPNEPAALRMAFSPDGSRLAVLEHGGTILILDVAAPAIRSPLKEGDLERFWNDLRSASPSVAWSAIFRLEDHPEQTCKFLAARLTPVVEEKNIGTLLADLDSPAFRVRDAASRTLLKFGEGIRPPLETALKQDSSNECRQRLKALLESLGPDRIPQPNDLRRLRALALLERMNTKNSRAMIGDLAKGLPESRVTKESKLALLRLAKRNAD